jgi:hypothetical protein
MAGRGGGDAPQRGVGQCSPPALADELPRVTVEDVRAELPGLVIEIPPGIGSPRLAY